MKITYAASLFPVLLCSMPLANAGWLGGPSNLEECMLERMKGQNSTPFVIATVRKACERDFAVQIDMNQIKVEWAVGSATETQVNITRNDSDFAVTKVVVDFSRAACDKAKDEDFNVRGEATFTGWIPGAAPKTSAAVAFPQELNQSSLQCMRTFAAYGKRIK